MKKFIFVVVFLSSFLFVGMASGKAPITFTVATFNLRYANYEDSLNGNGWGQRCPYVTKLIKFHDFDIFGTQEGLYEPLEQMKQMLPAYDYIGIGRDDGKKKGEHSAIFYKTAEFELLDHGDFWLSQDQTKPNMGWDAVCFRICTWGKFKVKKTGFTFIYFNLHMDHRGIVARLESSKLILEKIKKMGKGIPVLLSGDFNVDQFSPSYKLINHSGILHDSYEMADLVYAPVGTYNGFNPNSFTESRIDHIFLTDNFTVLKYGVLTDTYRSTNQKRISSDNAPKEVELNANQARCPSDHFPVMISVQVNK